MLSGVDNSDDKGKMVYSEYQNKFQGRMSRVDVTQTQGGGGMSLFGRDAAAYSNKTKIEEKKEKYLIINKNNIVTDRQKMQELIEEDEFIDLDKIKKYFENVVNDKHFLEKYKKAQQLSEQGQTEGNLAINSKKNEISIAKAFLRESLTARGPDHMRIAMEQTRLSTTNDTYVSPKKEVIVKNDSDLLAQIRKSQFQQSPGVS